jgi:7-cyano-7-deazaguanine synthase in queuosine biosynthesis
MKLEQKNKEKTVLLGFSGGLDSTYVLWYLLKHTNYKVHAHYIQMQYTTDDEAGGNLVVPHRWEAENQAVNKIDKYFRSNNYREYSLTTGIYNAPASTIDIEIVLFMLAQVAMNLIGNVVIATGRVMEDDERWSSLGTYYPGTIARKIMRLSIKNNMNILPVFRKAEFPNVSLNTYCPAENKNKIQIMKEMPKELIDLTWSCRNPKKDGMKFIECGRCHSCLARNKKE